MSSQHASQQKNATTSSSSSSPQYRRPPKDRVLIELQERAKLTQRVKEQEKKLSKPSDEPEGMVIHVDWKPQPNALGVPLKSTEDLIAPEELVIVSVLLLQTRSITDRVHDRHE